VNIPVRMVTAVREQRVSFHQLHEKTHARLQRKMAYEVAATVRLSGANVSPCEVRATLSVQTADGRQQYIGVGKYAIGISMDLCDRHCTVSWFGF
jgi:hypothetical protein